MGGEHKDFCVMGQLYMGSTFFSKIVLIQKVTIIKTAHIVQHLNISKALYSFMITTTQTYRVYFSIPI